MKRNMEERPKKRICYHKDEHQSSQRILRHCCLVDDHCDIISFVHAFYRTNKILEDTKVIMVHWDAHPDLSLPSRPGGRISDWEDPDNLYDILSEASGISEFILPLFASKLVHQIIWIKSPWSDQLPNGNKSFSIFDIKEDNDINEEGPKLNWLIPYYLDEQVCSSNKVSLELSSNVDVNCLITDVQTNIIWDKENNIFITNHLNSHEPCESKENIAWILDIDLDYFSTQNPFRLEFIQKLQSIDQTLELSEIENFINGIMKLIKYADYRCQESFDSIETYESDLQIHKLRLSNLLNNLKLINTIEKRTEPIDQYLNEYPRIKSQLLPEDRFSLEKYSSLLDQNLVDWIIDSWSLLLLPHHLSTKEEIDQLINEMEEYIQRFSNKLYNISKYQCNLPMFITIAKSIDDEYTPPKQVEDIYNQVFNMLEKVFQIDIVPIQLLTDPLIISHSLIVNKTLKIFDLHKNLS